MNRKSKLALLLAALSILTVFAAGCQNEPKETTEIHNPAEVDPPELAEGEFDITLEMIPLTDMPAMFSAVPTASGTTVKRNAKALIDYSNTKDGYIMIQYLEKTTKALRVQVKGPSSVVYTYTLKSDGTFEVFPLSDGNGSYQVNVFENIEGSKYSVANSVTTEVKLANEFAPFLRPNQYVNFKTDSNVVTKAAELTTGLTAVHDKVKVVYEFVISTLSYDKELAATVQSGYLPDVDAVMAKGKGICFDYAAVMTSMLRSQGVPSKLVVGYTGDIYHAWISVYSEEDGWVSTIKFDGKTWMLMDPTFADTGGQSTSVMQYIGDGTNYTSKYLY